VKNSGCALAARDSPLETYRLPPRLTGAVRHEFLRNFLPQLLQRLALLTKVHLWFARDGAPRHFLLAVREFLNNVFPKQLMRRRGPTEWPAPSPNVNLLYIYLWGHLNSTV
jgi:hypothetical protein